MITDYFIICTCDNHPHTKAVLDNIEKELKTRNERTLGVEGLTGGQWVLMDYNDVIVHIFDEETRKYYDLESLWIDAPRLDVDTFAEQGEFIDLKVVE